MYEVFLSYSSVDRAWAQRLYDSLAARGVKLFFDQRSLRDGEGWEQQLNGGLKQSRHLLCLWSKNAFESAWVQWELASFKVQRMDDPSHSKLLLVRLDDRKSAYGSLQEIDDSKVRAAYGQAPDAMAASEWQSLVDRILEALQMARPGISIPLVPLTLTSAQVHDMGQGDRSKLQSRLGLGADALAHRYGSERRDWRPYGTETLEEMLDKARADLNRWLQPDETMDWELPGDDFWTDAQATRKFARRIANARLGAILVDPVAMVVSEVQSKLGFFSGCLHCENVAVIAVPVSPTPVQDNQLRGWLGEFAATLFDGYLEPPRAADQLPSARFGVGLGDVAELRRLMQRSVADFMRRTLKDGGAPRNPFTTF